MKAIINAKIIKPDGVYENETVIYQEKIISVGKNLDLSGCEIIDAKGLYLMPGFIDIHTHGYKGYDISNGNKAEIEKIAESLPKTGVTAFCPTTMTAGLERVKEVLDAVSEVKEENLGGAEILGANLEGPFISKEKKGAQEEKYIIPPNSEFVLKNKNSIKLLTVAPEEDKNFEFIKTVSENTDIVVSVGHTNADYITAKLAFENGATHITHLFNGMTRFSHREPGVVGAALENDSISCEIIADTFHISPALYKPLEKLKSDKLILITDCLSAGGMPDGDYTLSGQKITLKGIECRLSDGTIAGSVLTMNKAVKNFLRYTDLPLHKVVNMATLNPARAIGEENFRGSIEIGKYADFVLADGNIDIKSTVIHGEKVY